MSITLNAPAERYLLRFSTSHSCQYITSNHWLNTNSVFHHATHDSTHTNTQAYTHMHPVGCGANGSTNCDAQWQYGWHCNPTGFYQSKLACTWSSFPWLEARWAPFDFPPFFSRDVLNILLVTTWQDTLIYVEQCKSRRGSFPSKVWATCTSSCLPTQGRVGMYKITRPPIHVETLASESLCPWIKLRVRLQAL